MTTLFIILIALNVADVYLTLRVLKQGGTEANPVLRYFMDRYGAKEALIGSKVLALGLVYLLLPWMPLALMLGLIVVYVWVVWHNWKQLKKE